MDGRPTILIVDDEPLNIDYLEQELEELDFLTISASGGRQALERVAQDAPDMVLLDIMMPEMDGFEVLQRLKAEAAWRDIPVVIISAMSDMSSVVRGIQLGADDYLPKPFNPILLNARLSAGLARKRAHDMEKLYLQSIERELEIGHRIQSGFLPAALPEIAGWEMVAYFQGAREVAGDFYDVFTLPEGCIGFFLGDVTDKGVGAALFMALYRSLLRAFMNADNYLNQDRCETTPADCLLNAVSRTNSYVCQAHETPLFATLFSGVLDQSTGELLYINAGHVPAKLIETSHTRQELPPNGPALGFVLEAEYQVGEAQIKLGETLLLQSDGLEDTLNENQVFFGKERLNEIIMMPETSAAGIIERISASLNDFRGEQSQFDDVTLLAINRLRG